MEPITGLAYGRIAIGALSLLSPSLTARLFLLDPKTNPQLSYMGRMFGSREIALGAITLASSGEARRRLVQLGIAVDGADAYTGDRHRGLRRGPQEDRPPARRRGRRPPSPPGCSSSRSSDSRPLGRPSTRQSTKLTTATSPTTTITARSTVGRQPAADGGAELAADRGADRDQARRGPVDRGHPRGRGRRRTRGR